MALEEGVVPPTLNLVDPDEHAGALDLTPLEARRRPVDVALINAFGFGGQNAALILQRWARRVSRPEEVARLVALVDRLEVLLERSALSELEVETEGTTVILRTPAAIARWRRRPGPTSRSSCRSRRAVTRRSRPGRAARTPSWRR